MTGPDPGPVLGIDTSAYTTSVAVLAPGGQVIDRRRVLPVPAGARGLRPSEAVWHQLQQLTDLLPAVLAGLAVPPAAVGVSVQPRPQPGSHLPPFAVGRLAAASVAAAWGCRLETVSHQEGHLAAGLWGLGLAPGSPAVPSRFYGLHVSGGTTELVQVEEERPGHWRVAVVGATADLYAGQLVDRVGVALGLPFPAGPGLERLAAGAQAAVPLPVGPPRRDGGRWLISFSGPETAALRALARGAEPAAVARGVEAAVARGLAKLLATQPPGRVVVVGGVAANLFVRRELVRRLGPVWEVGFGPPALSGDNAVGVAWLAARRAQAET
ncbi:Peptidase_M22 domain-containing protein [Candidatus Hydrogenisulfobacillus filiaventi]|uniref:N(6)-L-threonylcarbamoyladenine synthase n=1 Tax=Candidatus Hydrogenisulfobacillus filiaventi TaxID=2707344 RepID=A0A6F8ZFU4_9FIRM|nr:peptidase M22 [Bacillota bacterium]CAB1128650.1 Peptidase_M22 domain-containing protein [Candidatus Hydrogenisulfobacillus filiaventi]